MKASLSVALALFDQGFGDRQVSTVLATRGRQRDLVYVYGLHAFDGFDPERIQAGFQRLGGQ